MKIWAYVILATILIGGAWKVLHMADQMGYDRAKFEVQRAAVKQQNEAVEEERKKWQATLAIAEGQIEIREVIVEKIRVVEKEIPKIIETIKFECRDLGADFMRVFNDSIRIGSDNQTGAPEVTAEPDDGV
jgi:hypothetical protein